MKTTTTTTTKSTSEEESHWKDPKWWKDQWRGLVKFIFSSPIHMFAAGSLFCIVVSGAILFLVMVGWAKVPDKHQKDLWVEVNSQILNAFFTIAALYNTPSRTFYMGCFFFCPRKCFEKYPYPPALVFLLLFLLWANCYAQFVVDIAMFYYTYQNRPFAMVVGGLVTSFLCGMLGGVLEMQLRKRKEKEDGDNNISPLSKSIKEQQQQQSRYSAGDEEMGQVARKKSGGEGKSKSVSSFGSNRSSKKIRNLVLGADGEEVEDLYHQEDFEQEVATQERTSTEGRE